eukprot:1158589-Pelagomonas_calceolata.AAC.2
MEGNSTCKERQQGCKGDPSPGRSSAKTQSTSGPPGTPTPPAAHAKKSNRNAKVPDHQGP